MKKLLAFVVVFMSAVCLIRYSISPESFKFFSLSSFLDIISALDLDFSNTISSIVSIRAQLVLPELPTISSVLDILDYVAAFMTYIFTFINGVIGGLISLVKDILDFLSSILLFVQRLIFIF